MQQLFYNVSVTKRLDIYGSLFSYISTSFVSSKRKDKTIASSRFKPKLRTKYVVRLLVNNPELNEIDFSEEIPYGK